MIKSIYLNGFKSFGAATTIDLREITLLYGENSAGKSSILQALQYAREVFCNDNLDCLKTELGGEFVNLHGFKNFVHAKDIANLIEIGLTVNSREMYLLKYGMLECGAANKFARSFLEQAAFNKDIYDDLTRIFKSNFLSFFVEDKLHLPIAKKDSDTIEMSVTISIGTTKRSRTTPLIVGIKVKIEGAPLIEIFHLNQKHLEAPNDDGAPLSQCSIFLNNDVIPNDYLSLSELISIYGETRIKPIFDEIAADSLLDEHDRDAGKLDCINDKRPTELYSHGLKSVDQINPEIEFEENALLARLRADASQRPSSGWRERLMKLVGKSEFEFETDWNFDSLAHFSSNDNSWYNMGLDNLIFESPIASSDDISASGREEDRIYFPNLFEPPANLSEIKDINFVCMYTGCLMAKAIDEVKSHLLEMRYVGPLRRHYTPPSDFKSRKEERCWADGLGAWDRLANSPGLIDTVNKWLSNGSLFGFDCTVETTTRLRGRIQNLLQEMDQGRLTELMALFDELNLEDRVTLRSKNGYNLESTEIGVGFSQVLPIVVAACGSPGVCLLLEQPELHIHVRLQAVLGDLLATNIKPRPNEVSQYIVETHSEALLLRLMRRIRETTKEIVTTGPRLLCDHIAVYHVAKNDGMSCAKRIELDTLGNLTEEWPDDLFDISFTERFGE